VHDLHFRPEAERRACSRDVPWEMLPLELGCSSGVTCWRRLRDWQEAGGWTRLHHELLRRLHDADRIDRSRACVDSSSIVAKKGALRRGLIQGNSNSGPSVRKVRKVAHLGEKPAAWSAPRIHRRRCHATAKDTLASTGNARVQCVPWFE
jgi:hypothetical protein